MDDIKEKAESFRRGLHLGLHAVADVIPWLDAVIDEEPEPDIAIIEAALSGSRGPLAVADRLAEVPGTFDRRAVTARLIGAMVGLLRRDPSKIKAIARWLFQLALDGDAPDDEAENFMWGFEDDLLLAMDGVYGDVNDLRTELQEFLSRYERI
ncbi:MAG TPA: hypothetical protein VKT77_10160 [Chthonomonadaceae bacterium]|nr:hypothetical protein [Chthonomonadaceae bacterium]